MDKREKSFSNRIFRRLVVVLIRFVPRGVRGYYVDGVNEYEFRARRTESGNGRWILFWLKAIGSVFWCQWIWLTSLFMKAWKAPFHVPSRQLSYVAFCFTFLFSIMVLFGLADPKGALDQARVSMTPVGLYLGVLFRFAFGLLLIGSARASMMPRTVNAFGVLSLLGGLTMLLIGYEGVAAWLTWWEAKGEGTLRGLMALSFIVWVFLTIVLTSRERESQESVH